MQRGWRAAQREARSLGTELFRLADTAVKEALEALEAAQAGGQNLQGIWLQDQRNRPGITGSSRSHRQGCPMGTYRSEG